MSAQAPFRCPGKPVCSRAHCRPYQRSGGAVRRCDGGYTLTMPGLHEMRMHGRRQAGGPAPALALGGGAGGGDRDVHRQHRLHHRRRIYPGEPHRRHRVVPGHRGRVALPLGVDRRGSCPPPPCAAASPASVRLDVGSHVRFHPTLAAPTKGFVFPHLLRRGARRCLQPGWLSAGGSAEPPRAWSA